MRALWVTFTLLSLYFASAADQEAGDVNGIVPESFVAEAPTTVSITRECFQKACMHGEGHEECRMSKIPCAPADKTQTPWSVFLEPTTKKQRLISLDASPGLVGVKMHKKEVDPDRAVKMPGVPAVAPPKLLKQMQQQDKLLQKIAEMEKLMMKKDPNHIKSRQNWLDLEKSVRHMEAGPQKLKSEGLLLKLAKELSDKETEELQQEKSSDTSSNTATPKTQRVATKEDSAIQHDAKVSSEDKKRAIKKILVKKMKDAAKRQEAQDKGNPSALAKDKMAEQMAPAFVKQFLDKATGVPTVDADAANNGDTYHGLPVGHRKCFERACLSKLPDGSCGAAVISCGAQNGKAPKDTSKLTRAEALKVVKKDMGPIAQGAGSTLAELTDLLKKHTNRSPAIVDQLENSVY